MARRNDSRRGTGSPDRPARGARPGGDRTRAPRRDDERAGRPPRREDDRFGRGPRREERGDRRGQGGEGERRGPPARAERTERRAPPERRGAPERRGPSEERRGYSGEEAPRREERARPERPETSRYVYGVNPVLEALRARPDRIDQLYLAEGEVARAASAEIFSRARDANVRVSKVPRERLSGMAEGGVHQGVVAELREYEYAELSDILAAAKRRNEQALVIALDGVQDPHNLGAIIRSAHALGAHGVVIPKDRAASVTGLVAKSSAGAVEHMRIARVTNVSRALEELKQAGLWIAAADPGGDQQLWQAKLDGPLVLVVGGEGPGIRPGVLGHCDFKLKIPMAGNVASLNASVAAALLMYEVVRQRAAVSPLSTARP